MVEPLAGLTIVRPLLGLRREELRGYLRARGRPWREDPSNQHLTTKRGWVRHWLLPTIEERIGLDPAARIARAGELLEAESAALRQAATLLLEELRLPAPPPLLARLALAHPIWRAPGRSYGGNCCASGFGRCAEGRTRRATKRFRKRCILPKELTGGRRCAQSNGCTSCN